MQKTNRKLQVSSKITRCRTGVLKHPWENELLYDKRDEFHPETIVLKGSIGESGVRNPIVKTLDNVVVDGNRRLDVVIELGRKFVHTRTINVKWSSLNRDERIALLRDFNQSRYKSVKEQLLETLVDISPEAAHEVLHSQRYKSVNAPERNGIVALGIEGVKKRHGISSEKHEHVDHIKKVVFKDRRDYWPMSVRAVHYPLLNYSFYRNTRLKLPYQNDDGSYDATCDLITRMRLNGQLPWEAFEDPTRPLKLFPAFNDVRQFVRQECQNLMVGYWRDLLQTQPAHIECLIEKNTVYGMALRVTEKYQIPTSSGRGFNSIDPFYELHRRFEASNKKRLILIVVSDYDPEGEMIPQVAGRTLRDDFGVWDDQLTIAKAGVTREQIEKYSLPSQNFAKESSVNHDWFVKRNDGDTSVYELEALEPEHMLADLEHAIRSVLDLDLFNREVEAEENESSYLMAARQTALDALKGLAE